MVINAHFQTSQAIPAYGYCCTTGDVRARLSEGSESRTDSLDSCQQDITIHSRGDVIGRPVQAAFRSVLTTTSLRGSTPEKGRHKQQSQEANGQPLQQAGNSDVNIV
jgi:hypothetical protein